MGKAPFGFNYSSQVSPSIKWPREKVRLCATFFQPPRVSIERFFYLLSFRESAFNGRLNQDRRYREKNACLLFVMEDNMSV